MTPAFAESDRCERLGRPVAALRGPHAGGALAEILEPAHGLLAPPGDVQALATLIPRVMSLDHRDARRRAVGFCSLDRMADAYTSLYEEVTR